jgi:hypothetical protein
MIAVLSIATHSDEANGEEGGEKQNEKKKKNHFNSEKCDGTLIESNFTPFSHVIM